MKIFCKFPTVNISKLNFWLVIRIAGFIWTTLKAIFFIFILFLHSIHQSFVRHIHPSFIRSIHPLFALSIHPPIHCSIHQLFVRHIHLSVKDVMVWKFLITIIVTKIIMVISIITVLLKCAGDVQKVLTHKSLYQVLYLKINKQQINWLFVCIITKTITLPVMFGF